MYIHLSAGAIHSYKVWHYIVYMPRDNIVFPLAHHLTVATGNWMPKTMCVNITGQTS